MLRILRLRAGQLNVPVSRGIISCILILTLFGALDTSALANTYYIDYSRGLNTNSGLSKSSPWKLSPGMAGFVGSYHHSGGDKFIFRGGVTWPANVLPLDIQMSGAAGYPDVYSADPTWYDGSTWTPPIL